MSHFYVAVCALSTGWFLGAFTVALASHRQRRLLDARAKMLDQAVDRHNLRSAEAVNVLDDRLQQLRHGFDQGPDFTFREN